MNKETMHTRIKEKKEIWTSLARKIWENPEIGYQEYQSSVWLTELLETEGFAVEKPFAGMDTAFRAIYQSRSGKWSPVIAYLSEYDALPGLGHGCGHNLIGVMSASAGIALKEVVDLHGGTVIVFGTPGEEVGGGKVTMAEQGYFDRVDAALMAHPSANHERSGVSLAMEALQFDFYGKSAHAAASPQNGINALDGVIQLFNSVNALRQHVTKDVRIHGIITEGGVAANVVPDYAQARFYVRCVSKQYLSKLVEKVKTCASAAASAMGCKVEISNYELGYDNLITNEALSHLYVSNLVELGIDPAQIKQGLDHGSIDIGNVSQRTAAIHPYIQLRDCPYGGHTVEFRDAVGDERGMETLLLGIQVLAATGYDLITEPSLLHAVRKEFLNNPLTEKTQLHDGGER